MVNTLVTHKRLKSLGIGCIAKELPKSYMVNFGKDDVVTCKKGAVEIVDTTNCKTITWDEYRLRIMSNKLTSDIVILGNEVKQYVGIGWISIGIVTMNDLTKYPRVV